MSKENGLRDTLTIMNVTTTSGLRSAFETSLSGMQKAVSKMDGAAQKMADGDVSPDQVVELTQAAILAKANALTERTADQLYGSMLNTVA